MRLIEGRTLASGPPGDLDYVVMYDYFPRLASNVVRSRPVAVRRWHSARHLR